MYVFFFFFKQKTAYEMRISDWSSDVCSSDLGRAVDREATRRAELRAHFESVHILGIDRHGRQRVCVERAALEALREASIDHDQIGRASCRERVCQYV